MRYTFGREHKYNAVRVKIDGHNFASKAEAARYLVLKELQSAGEIKNLWLQPKFTFPMGFSYIPDFEYECGGRLVIEDVKGMETPEFKLKAKCFAYFYPAYQFFLVKCMRRTEYIAHLKKSLDKPQTVS